MASACSVAVATDQKIIGAEFLRTPAATTCVLVTISLICTCFLVVCGVLVVREYSLGMAYEATRCRLKNITHTRDISCMYCAGNKEKFKEKGASQCQESQFPCIRLTVIYPSSSDGGQEAMLHMDSIQASGPYSQCSYSICLRTREENEEAVGRYADTWRSLQEDFPCFYNREERSSVIALKTYSQSDVVHAMLWPSLVVLVCGIIFLRLEMRRRHLTWCGRVGGREGAAEKLNPSTKLSQVVSTGGEYGRLEGEVRHVPDVNQQYQHDTTLHHHHHHHSHHHQADVSHARRGLPDKRMREEGRDDQHRLLKSDRKVKAGVNARVKVKQSRAIMKDDSLDTPGSGEGACRQVFYSSLPVLDKLVCEEPMSGSVEQEQSLERVEHVSLEVIGLEHSSMVKPCTSAHELLVVNS